MNAIKKCIFFDKQLQFNCLFLAKLINLKYSCKFFFNKPKSKTATLDLSLKNVSEIGPCTVGHKADTLSFWRKV